MMIIYFILKLDLQFRWISLGIIFLIGAIERNVLIITICLYYS